MEEQCQTGSRGERRGSGLSHILAEEPHRCATARIPGRQVLHCCRAGPVRLTARGAWAGGVLPAPRAESAGRRSPRWMDTKLRSNSGQRRPWRAAILGGRDLEGKKTRTKKAGEQGSRAARQGEADKKQSAAAETTEKCQVCQRILGRALAQRINGRALTERRAHEAQHAGQRHRGGRRV